MESKAECKFYKANEMKNIKKFLVEFFQDNTTFLDIFNQTKGCSAEPNGNSTINCGSGGFYWICFIWIKWRMTILNKFIKFIWGFAPYGFDGEKDLSFFRFSKS